MTMRSIDPPGAAVRRWRCSDCGEQGTFDELRAKSCAKARVGDLSPDQQLAEWVNGLSVCHNSEGECCPDFSCCQPQLLWPPESVVVIHLCGAHLCVNNAVCSYLLRGAHVYLCATHLGELSRKTKLSLQEIAVKLPEFEWIGDEEKSA
jgi:hypothetical protein